MAEASVKEQVGEVVSRAKRRVKLEKPSAADEGGHLGIVRGALRAFGEGDHDEFLDTLNQDVSWEAPSGRHFPGSGDHRGRDEVRENYIGDLSRTYSEFGFRPDSFLDTEVGAVVVIGHFHGKGVEGANLDTEAVQVWEFDGNSASRVCIYADSAEFPEVVSEQKLQEWEQEEKEKQKEEKQKESENDESEDGPKGESEDSSEGESEESSKNESQDDSD